MCEQLRAKGPVCFVESVGFWLVTRWDEVQYVDKSPELFTGETEPSTLNRTFGKNLLGSEGPYHERIRKIIYPWFRVGAIGDYPDNVIAPLAGGLVDSFADRGEAELVSEFAEPLSARVLKQALGLGFVEEGTLRRWFVELATGAANFEGDPEKQKIADAASAEVNAVLASANRDERNWTEPERYDVHRREGGHLAFATGPHLCIGARLARYETRTAWRLLLDRLPNLRLDPDRPIEISGWEFRSPHHLHVQWN